MGMLLRISLDFGLTWFDQTCAKHGDVTEETNDYEDKSDKFKYHEAMYSSTVTFRGEGFGETYGNHSLPGSSADN